MKTIFTKKSITACLAQQMINAAVRKAEQIGKAMTIAILDESGNLKVFHRMDGAALAGIEVAQNKAYTSAANAWGHATHEVYEYSQSSPALLMGLSHISRYTFLGGGFPIKIDNEIVGGIGVSGGTAEQDIEVARAALAINK
jgi:uncharacterized protein GlcG (DUF336 family)